MKNYALKLGQFARSLASDERGSAITEAVIMIPAFLIIWASVLWVNTKYQQQIFAHTIARECGWRRATDGCPDDDNNPEATRCQFQSGQDLNDAWAGQNNPTATAQSNVNFVDSLESIMLGKAITANRQMTAKVPKILGSKTLTYTAPMWLSCNEKKGGMKLGDLIGKAWKSLAGNASF